MTVRPWHRVAVAMFAVGWGANQFSPVLIVYRDDLGLSAATRALLFGVYAAGLIPGLLIGGGASDRYGRRKVVLPFVALSPVATLLLVVFHTQPLGLGAGRLVAGVCSGVVFGAATAWVRELTTGGAEGTAARRAAVALTLGFGVGPLVAALVAEWAPDPLWLPYLPHLVLGVGAILFLLPAPESGPADATGPLVRIPAACRTRRFARTIVPVAPWVFACASLSFAILPGETGNATVLLAGVGGALALGGGVGVQPLAQRLEDRRPLSAGAVGLLSTVAGLGIGIVALGTGSRGLVLLAAPFYGVGYGCCLISGLRETERVADPHELGATLSVFYALTYVGFAAPYVIDLLNGAVGDQGALAIMAAGALVCLAIGTTGARTPGATGRDSAPTPRRSSRSSSPAR